METLCTDITLGESNFPVFLYVFGSPGAGKTHGIRSFIGKIRGTRHESKYDLINYVTFRTEKGRTLYVLGTYDGSSNDGTDKLSMGAQRSLCGFLNFALSASDVPPIILGEGYRFSNISTVVSAITIGFYQRWIFLEVPEYVRSIRLSNRGADQNTRWMNGAITKMNNFLAFLRENHVRCDVFSGSDELVDFLIMEIG